MNKSGRTDTDGKKHWNFQKDPGVDHPFLPDASFCKSFFSKRDAVKIDRIHADALFFDVPYRIQPAISVGIEEDPVGEAIEIVITEDQKGVALPTAAGLQCFEFKQIDAIAVLRLSLACRRMIAIIAEIDRRLPSRRCGNDFKPLRLDPFLGLILRQVVGKILGGQVGCGHAGVAEKKARHVKQRFEVPVRTRMMKFFFHDKII